MNVEIPVGEIQSACEDLMRRIKVFKMLISHIEPTSRQKLEDIEQQITHDISDVIRGLDPRSSIMLNGDPWPDHPIGIIPPVFMKACMPVGRIGV